MVADPTAQEAANLIKAAALNLQTNLTTQLAAVGSVATNFDSKMATQNAELAKLRDTLVALQKENANIRTELPKLALEAARKLPPPAAPAPTPPPVAVAPATPAPPPALPTTITSAPPPVRGSTFPSITITTGTPADTGKTPKGYEEAVLTLHNHDNAIIPWRTFVPQ